MVTNPRTDRPLQHIGILILMVVDVWQNEPSRFDRVLNDGERPSGFGPGDLEHHAHASEPDRTALARLYYELLHLHLRPPFGFPLRSHAKWVLPDGWEKSGETGIARGDPVFPGHVN